MLNFNIPIIKAKHNYLMNVNDLLILFILKRILFVLSYINFIKQKTDA